MKGATGLVGQLTITPYNATAEMQADLGSRATVINEGVSGTTLHQLMTGTDGVHGPFTQTMATSYATYVIENMGINDAAQIVAQPANYSLAQFDYELRSYVEYVRSYGKNPILEEPNPVCFNDAVSAQLDQIVQIIDNVAAIYGVPLVSQYQYIKSLPNWQSMLPDCIHPGLPLYKIKGDREAYVVEQVLSWN